MKINTIYEAGSATTKVINPLPGFIFNRELLYLNGDEATNGYFIIVNENELLVTYSDPEFVDTDEHLIKTLRPFLIRESDMINLQKRTDSRIVFTVYGGAVFDKEMIDKYYTNGLFYANDSIEIKMSGHMLEVKTIMNYDSLDVDSLKKGRIKNCIKITDPEATPQFNVKIHKIHTYIFFSAFDKKFDDEQILYYNNVFASNENVEFSENKGAILFQSSWNYDILTRADWHDILGHFQVKS